MTAPNDQQEADLEFARQARKKVVNVLETNGTPPEDPRLLTLYLANLDGMERTALGQKRINADKELGNVQAQAAGLLAELFRHPKTITVGRGERVGDVPVLDKDIAPTRIVDGELAGQTSAENYDDFMQRTEQAK